MEWMHKALPILAMVALATIVPAPPTAAAATAATPAPSASRTPPPLIYHIITRPLCSELHKHIAPAIGMMLQNDQQIAKGPDLFKRYNRAGLEGVDNSASNKDVTNGTPSSGEAADEPFTAAQNMALLGMENLVSPIANNIIAVEKVLDSPALIQGTGTPDDDKQLKEIRDKLLQALATQSAALDIINGFVTTQQLADIQHSGEEYISALNQTNDLKNGIPTTPTPFPGTYDPNQAGLPPNPYTIDLANVPGLTLGYNPVTHLIDALHWTIGETQKRENDAAKSVMQSAALCSPSSR
jgi:hypothetical protein